MNSFFVFFFFTRPSDELQNEHCVYCALGGVMNSVLSARTTKETFVQKTHVSLFLPAQLRCAVETEATEQGQSGRCSFNTQLKAHVFSKLVVCGYCSFNNMLAGNQI